MGCRTGRQVAHPRRTAAVNVVNRNILALEEATEEVFRALERTER
jgi:hypothetical protein